MIVCLSSQPFLPFPLLFSFLFSFFSFGDVVHRVAKERKSQKAKKDQKTPLDQPDLAFLATESNRMSERERVINNESTINARHNGERKQSTIRDSQETSLIGRIRVGDKSSQSIQFDFWFDFSPSNQPIHFHHPSTNRQSFAKIHSIRFHSIPPSILPILSTRR